MDEVLQQMETETVFCRRCGRKLKSQQAKDLGFGPTCYKIYLKQQAMGNRKKLFVVNKEG